MNKEYLLDGEPISFNDLIQFACDEYGYKSIDGLKLTSEAATILRKNGHIVEDNLNEDLS